MGYIKLDGAALQPPPSMNQTVTISSRLTFTADDPANYTVHSNSVVLQPNGLFTTPFYIFGLPEGQFYTVKIVNNCGGAGMTQNYYIPVSDQTEPVTTAVPVTTIPPTTIAPTTVPPTTAGPTTPAPTTPKPATTVPPTTQPITTAAPTTNPITTPVCPDVISITGVALAGNP